MKAADTIKPLTKVSLKINTIQERGSQPATSPMIKFDFVYGIATEGLTAFEVTLSDKAPGDQVTIQIAPTQARAYFEHLLSPLKEAFQTELPSHINVKVASVAPVTDRELVRALAEKNEGGGCGGDCGCGCG